MNPWLRLQKSALCLARLNSRSPNPIWVPTGEVRQQPLSCSMRNFLLKSKTEERPTCPKRVQLSEVPRFQERCIGAQSTALRTERFSALQSIARYRIHCLEFTPTCGHWMRRWTLAITWLLFFIASISHAVAQEKHRVEFTRLVAHWADYSHPN